MIVVNRYGQFTDAPVDERWFLKFNVLFIRTSHRKILNRQPVLNDYIAREGMTFKFNPYMIIDRVKTEDFNFNYIELCN